MTTTANTIGTITENLWTDTIPALKIEANGDGTLTLEQDWCGNVERVALHAVHVRHLAGRLGMVGAMSASDVESLQAERERVAGLRQENDRLKRNMLRLQSHALTLQEGFREHADWRHADLGHDMGVINALVNLFDMAVDDFADDYTAQEPSANPPAAQREPMGFVATGNDEQKATPAVAAPPQQLRLRGKCAPQQLQLEG